MLRSLQLFCGTLAAGVAVFALATWLVLRTQGRPLVEPAEPGTLLPWVLVTAGFLCLIAAPFLGRSAYLRVRDRPADGPGVEVLEAYRASNLVAFALREAGGLLGGVTALVTGEILAGYLLAAAALAMMARAWPRRSHLEALMSPGP